MKEKLYICITILTSNINYILHMDTFIIDIEYEYLPVSNFNSN